MIEERANHGGREPILTVTDFFERTTEDAVYKEILRILEEDFHLAEEEVFIVMHSAGDGNYHQIFKK